MPDRCACRQRKARPAADSSQHAEAKAEQNALLDPGVDAPAGGRGGVGLGGAHFAALEGGAQGEEGVHGGGIAGCGCTGGEVTVNGLFKIGGGHCKSECNKTEGGDQGLGTRDQGPRTGGREAETRQCRDQAALGEDAGEFYGMKGPQAEAVLSGRDQGQRNGSIARAVSRSSSIRAMRRGADRESRSGPARNRD